MWLKYAMVVAGKKDLRKDALGMVFTSRLYAIEHHRNESDLERHAQAVRNAGGQVIAVGLESDTRFLQRARMAVAQLTTGSWSVERAREYLMEHLRAACRDPYLVNLNDHGGCS